MQLKLETTYALSAVLRPVITSLMSCSISGISRCRNRNIILGSNGAVCLNSVSSMKYCRSGFIAITKDVRHLIVSKIIHINENLAKTEDGLSPVSVSVSVAL